ncbi:MAG: protocatechuate 3,4-dioxygenase [Burkholderiales bacterium]|nr:protocatechuate 3,4-dioxygenase [Burkholderiales bacterium]
MAHLVAAFGTSHSPALGSPAEDFVEHARRDEAYPHHLDLAGNPTTYAALVRSAPPTIAQEITPERVAARVAACAGAIARLDAAIAAAELDALVIVGDDQHEQYRGENLPAFLVYWGERITNTVSDLPASAPEYWKRARAQYHEPDGPRDYPVAADLGRHLIEFLVAREFDVAHGRKLPRDRGEGHAFGFVHRRLMTGRIVPVLPVAVNTYYPPNQPRPGRCYRLGQAIRAAVEAWAADGRVGIIASGGLSHFTVNEPLDRAVLDACRAGDGKRLAALPLAQLNSGNSEIRNWIVAAGAAEGLRTRWQEYIPFYRTPAGTGCAMAFAEWR